MPAPLSSLCLLPPTRVAGVAAWRVRFLPRWGLSIDPLTAGAAAAIP
jgi:hypothetical protein